MKILIDWNEFEGFQKDILYEIIRSAYQNLLDAGIDRDKIPDLVAGIAFDMCCVIDGSTIIPRPGGRILPILTFAKDASMEELISSGSGSWMHELVHAAVEEHLKRMMG